MPLKLSVGLSRKLGQPNYGSLGAVCQVELELDQSLLQSDLETFQRRVQRAYVACSQAVDDELARQQQRMSHSDSAALMTGGSADVGGAGDFGRSSGRQEPPSGNGESHRATPRSSRGQISDKQLQYIRQLAGQISEVGMAGLPTLCSRMFGKDLPVLSSFEASSLIDQLKAIKSGQVPVGDLLRDGAAA